LEDDQKWIGFLGLAQSIIIELAEHRTLLTRRPAGLTRAEFIDELGRANVSAIAASVAE
jgi:hypothetical protein